MNSPEVQDRAACVKQVEPQTQSFVDDGSIPNNPTLPLMIYKQVVSLSGDDPAEIFEALFDANDWPPIWRNGIEPYHHYHSMSHEVVGIYSGSANTLFGGEHGTEIVIEAGDVVLIPAGTGHKCLSRSDDLGIVGAYPAGCVVDVRRGQKHERPACLERIASLSVPPRDPIYGKSGPMFDLWR